MKQRGRKSAASAGFAKPPSASMLNPPDYLGKREAEQWRDLVDRLGSEHFPPETRGLFATLCEVTISLRDVNAALRELGPGVPSGAQWKRYRDLMRLRGQLAMQLASFSTKLRITPTSREIRRRWTSEYARRVDQPALKPWDDNVLPLPRRNGGEPKGDT